MPSNLYEQHRTTGWKYHQIPRYALGSETQLEGTHNQETDASETKSKRTVLADW